jgi:hypothetical protein
VKEKEHADDFVHKVEVVRKTISVLADLRLFEEAILFALALPDLNKVEELMEIGIQFQEISSNFVETVLVPFYTSIEFNFAVLEQLYGYLMMNCTQLADVISHEKQYI